VSPHPRNVVRSLVLVVGALCIGDVADDAAAQVAPAMGGRGVAREPVVIEPATAMNEIRAAYIKSPTAERVTMTLRSSERAIKGEGVIITRLWQKPVSKPAPAGDGAPAPDEERQRPVVERVLSVEMGPLRMVAREGVLRVIHTQHDTTVYERAHASPLNEASVRAMMPPLALPALAIVAHADDDAGVNVGAARPLDLTPWTTNVRWTSATIDPQAERPEMVLRGRSDQGEVTLVADGASGRLLRLVAGLGAGNGGTIEMSFESLPAGDPATWAIELGKRRRVGSLADLTSAEPALKVADVLTFIDAAGVFDAKQADVSSAIVLLLNDANPAQPALSDHDTIAQAAVQAISGMPEGLDAKSVLTRAFVVGRKRPEADDATAMAAVLATRWPSVMKSGLLNPRRAEGEPEPVPQASAVGLIGPARSTIQRLSLDANVVMCVVDRQMRIHAIIEVDGRTDDVNAMTRELSEASRRAAATVSSPETPAVDPAAPAAPAAPTPAVPTPATPASPAAPR